MARSRSRSSKGKRRRKATKKVAIKKNTTYKIVKNRKDADGCAWAFLKPKQEIPVKIYYKFQKLGAKEVRIQVEWAGLCYSDVHKAQDDWGPSSYPLVPGHENIGTIIAVGRQVKNFQVGDKVGFGPQTSFCGECENCDEGHHNVCPKRVIGYDPKFGGYNTHYQAPTSRCYKLPKFFWHKNAAPLLCAGATLFAPIMNFSRPGDHVAILGIGGLGHMGVKMGHKMGRLITAFTGSQDKSIKKSILKMGAERIVNSRNLKAIQKEEMNFHCVISTIPKSRPQFDISYQNLVKPFGNYVQVSSPPTGGSGMPFNNLALVKHAKTIVGSHVGNMSEYKRMIRFCCSKKVLCDCNIFPFEKTPEAWTLLKHGKPKYRCCIEVGNWARKNGFWYLK